MTQDEYLNNPAPTCPDCGEPKADVRDRRDPYCVEGIGRHAYCPDGVCQYLSCADCYAERKTEV